MGFPHCHPSTASSFQAALRDLGERWAAEPARPRIREEMLSAWDALLEAWIAVRELPLLVRKFRGNRGLPLVGRGGRTLIPTDNSPAQWAYSVAYDGFCPRPDEVIPLLESGRLPVAMAMGADERRAATFTGFRAKCPSTSEAGWKLAHIRPVGLSERGSPEIMPASRIEEHFRLLMSPRNMLVVPADWAGLAEVPQFIAGFQAAGAVRPAS